MRPADVLDEMLEALLVVETPEGGFRSRMAETMRLLATLRQSFANRQLVGGPAPGPWTSDSCTGPAAGRDVTCPPAISCPGWPRASPRLPTASRSRLVPPELSGFQERATGEILAAIRSGTDRGVMVTAGTGSGKSLAFYLPAFCAIGESIADDPAHGVRSLAIYPRNELLKDQFSALLRQARELQQASATGRPIVIGTWFGATPYSAQSVSQGQADGWAEVKARRPPRRLAVPLP